MSTIILCEDRETQVSTANGLWLTAADAERATSWTLKPEGMCLDDRCIPMPTSSMRGDRIDLEAFWRRLGAPVVHDDARQVWALGASAEMRTEALRGSIAPDFTLPDLDGKPHTFSALRGRKVFLATWASW